MAGSLLLALVVLDGDPSRFNQHKAKQIVTVAR
jgi:hypothetical protein